MCQTRGTRSQPLIGDNPVAVEQMREEERTMKMVPIPMREHDRGFLCSIDNESGWKGVAIERDRKSDIEVQNCAAAIIAQRNEICLTNIPNQDGCCLRKVSEDGRDFGGCRRRRKRRTGRSEWARQYPLRDYCGAERLGPQRVRWRLVGGIEQPREGENSSRMRRVAITLELRMPCWQTTAVGLDFEMKPIAWLWRRARKVVKPSRRRHHTQECKLLGLSSTKTAQELWSARIDIVGIDAIKFEGYAAVRTRAQ